ncbi:unnamed protein product [Fusarium fujikuroi]|uniref:Heterokaryon incompatibility domain-containing protein n=1 Tax=Fusarium fujikuroi TaxID=5127 RepID=A0A9Q9RJF0_FUSFU|nr:unnamed protein product [Fusarium fujikuroi]
MNEIQHQVLQLPGGIQPHYCRLCRSFVIIDDVKDTEDKGKVKKNLHIRRTYTLKQVCEFANSGCVMFSLQLTELHQAENARFLSMSGLLREICGAACNKRLQQFYPLVPSLVLEELNGWSLEIKLSLEDASWLASYWLDKDSKSRDLDPRPMILFTSEESCLSSRIANRPLQPKADLMTAKRWLQECLDYHEDCGDTVEREMPSRLIFIGDFHCTILRLEDTKTAQFVPYAALSYCWGDAGRNRFKTEKETLAMRKQGFDYIQLPSTLRDAVKVARTLGLEYLWVDALCIVQDCEEDKSKEISKMWQIYQGATIVISAALASHSDQGFLHERDLESCYLSTWAIPWHKVDNEGNRFEEFVFCAEGEIRRVRKEPIDSRAWTLQENELATRVLRFGSSQMIWRCPHGYFVDGGSTEDEPLDKFSTVDTVKWSYEWTNMVEEFTTRFIGKAEDRLPAFAAVAADYAERHNIGPDEYKAGLWTSWLAFGLLWYIKDVDDEATYPDILSTEEKSPTWSWHLARSGISWPETIPYRGDSDKFNLVVESSQVELADEKVEYGRVKRGCLEVSGALLKIHLLGTRPVYSKPNGEVTSAPIVIRWDSKDISSEKEFFCLEVRDVHESIAEGIVLKQSGGFFYRVGYFEPDRKSTPIGSIWRDRKTILISFGSLWTLRVCLVHFCGPTPHSIDGDIAWTGGLVFSHVAITTKPAINMGVGPPRVDKYMRLLSRLFEFLALFHILKRANGPHTVSQPPTDLQSTRRRFLSSLCFFCDYQKGGKTTTSMALEFLGNGVVVFWIASNVSPNNRVIAFLSTVLETLQREPNSTDTERETLTATLTARYIEFAAPRLRKERAILHRSMRFCETYLTTNLGTIETPGKTEVIAKRYLADKKVGVTALLDWFTQFSATADPLILCQAAYNARHAPQMATLEALRQELIVAPQGTAEAFRSVKHLIGRLAEKIRIPINLVNDSRLLRPLLDSYEIRRVEAPVAAKMPMADGLRNLDSILRRMLPAGDSRLKDMQAYLGQLDGSIQLEDAIRAMHDDDKTNHGVHAEIQMLEDFHRNRRKFVGNDRYIACSKLACLCCRLYFKWHPGRFIEPESHQKSYLTWRPIDLPEGGGSQHWLDQRRVLANVSKELSNLVQEQIISQQQPNPWQPDSVTNITAAMRSVSLSEIEEAFESGDGESNVCPNEESSHRF